MIWWGWRTKFEGKLEAFRANNKKTQQAWEVVNVSSWNPMEQQIAQQFSRKIKREGDK